MRALSMLVLASCATTSTTVPPAGGPRGLRATEHLDAARQHDQLSTRSWTWPDAMTPGPDRSGVSWVRTWDTAEEHEQLTVAHRSKAAELQTAYEQACGTRPLAEVSVSPLLRFANGGWNTAHGVILYLAPEAGPADRFLQGLECHRAWMMLAPAAMDDCLLDLPGLQVDARADDSGITVSISVRDPKLVSELHRRAAHDLESSEQLRHPAPR
ncbi:MAG: hypothetical protein WKG01_28190 [Kofleriaceae bacterium]